MTNLTFHIRNHEYDIGIIYRKSVEEQYPRHLKQWNSQIYRDSLSFVMDQVIDNVIAEMEIYD